MDPVAVLAALPALGGALPPTYLVGCRPADVDEGIGLVRAVQRRRARRRPTRYADWSATCQACPTDDRPELTMCLGIPGQVVEMVEGYGGQLALVDVQGARRGSTSACSSRPDHG